MPETRAFKKIENGIKLEGIDLIANAVDAAFKPDGITVSQFNREAAGQTVFHVHMHVVPRMEGEELALHSRIPGDPLELEAMAQRLSKRAYAMRVEE